MTRRIRPSLCVLTQSAAGMLGALLLFFAPAYAQSADLSSGIRISDAWIRWLPANLPAGGYVTLTNASDQPLVLLGAASPDYGQVQLHRSVTQNGVVLMQPVAQLTLAPHSSLSFASQGYHFMLMQPRVPLAPGDHVPMTLRFADGRSLTASFEVRGPTADPPAAQRAIPDMPGMAH